LQDKATQQLTEQSHTTCKKPFLIAAYLIGPAPHTMVQAILTAVALLLWTVGYACGQDVAANQIILHNDIIHVHSQPHLQVQRSQPQTRYAPSRKDT
jgi:hypothetical protein